MKKILLIFILAFVLTNTVFSDNSVPGNVVRALRDAGVNTVKEGIPIIDFTLPKLDGSDFTLSQQQGKVIFLNFWATWCPPCRQEMPSMEALYQRFRTSGLEIIAVNLGESREQVTSFMRQNNLSFPVVLDTRQSTGSMYNARSIPTTYIIDRRNLIIGMVVGSINWNSPAVITAFEELLSSP
jgi:peroxiredoxin